MAIKFVPKAQVEELSPVATKVKAKKLVAVQLETGVAIQDQALVAQVDTLVALEDALTDARPLLKEYDAVKKVLASAAADEVYPDDQPVEFTGNTGVVRFTAKTTTKVVVDMNGLIGRLKKVLDPDPQLAYEKLLGMLQLNLGDVEKYLSAAELEKYYVKKAGSRRIASVSKT